MGQHAQSHASEEMRASFLGDLFGNMVIGSRQPYTRPVAKCQPETEVQTNMNAASLAEIRKTLIRLEAGELLEICLRLARFKKDNKELLTYLLFLSGDESGFINSLCDEIDEYFHDGPINQKKTLRKIIRWMDKWLRFSGNKETAIKVRIYFCRVLKESGTPYRKSKVMSNMFEGQIGKVQKLIDGLHADIRHDFEWELKGLKS